ncbi:retrovirus-related pol polyprotein from transposon TNT 1-94 [Tanacetum coccineum]|uniref:Retrovirus-related pol polyprotein from transposon TNT 1-94 n=1 Tax=Tanacetum coccineum TaxID=301880 RepID=A0ABQ5D275_9ASTR
MTESSFIDSRFDVPVFSPGDDLIACLNKAMAFLTVVASSRFPTTNNQLRTSSNLRNQATIQDGRVTVQQVQGRQGQNYSGTTYKGNATSSRGNTTSGQTRVVKCYNCQGEGHMARQCTQPKRPRNAAWYKEKAMLAEAQEAGQLLDEEQLAFLADPGIPASQTQTVIPHNAAFQTEDLDTYDSDCDDLSSAQAVLMANISNYGSDVISEDFEQSPVMDFTDNEISSDNNIILYSQYLQETQQATVQDTNLQAQQDSIILYVIEKMSEQMINHVNNWEKANKEHNNESITAELERYKERVKTFEQRLNIDLSSRKKMIDSQMNDMIREKLALKEQIDSLEKTLSKQIKEKESLFKTFTVFKNESKEKENKYMENEIDLENKIKELDNIVYKVGQSAKTVNMLTKLQPFYDNTYKQALGYQNPFYLRKAQRIKPTLYDGVVVSKTHVAMHVIDNEETLILEEESRSKMFEKAKDPEVIAKKISHKPIDYEKLNSLIEDFETRFSPQQELSAEQAFWFHTFNPTIEPSYSPPVIVDVPSELPKVSLVNASLKKLKFHLTQFDSVVKKRTTPSALEEGEWGFEHTKAVFNNEIIPFLKSLKDIFNVFDKDLLNEITEVQTVFDQMEASVQQFSVDKKCLEIAKKEILLENDRLLQKVMIPIKSLKTNTKGKNVNHDKCDLDPIKKELENSVAKLLSKNERLCNEINNVKQVFKYQFNSIKRTRVRHKEQSDSLINKLNLKSVENKDLKAQIQDKVFVITSLKNDLRKLKGKEIVENVIHTPSVTTIAPGMFKLNFEPLPPRLLQNREVHIAYLRNTQEQANILREIVKQAKVKQPLDSELVLACKYVIRIQELLIYVQGTCPNAITPSAKKVTVKPMNNVKKVRSEVFYYPVTDKCETDILCATCNKSMFDGVHDKCLLDLVQNGNNHTKSAKKHKKQNIWKPTGHVFTEVGFKWKPTGRTFTIVGNSCPLTRFTSTNVVPPKQTTSHSDDIQKPELKVYSRKPKNVKNIGSSKKAKIVESKNANHSEPNQTWGSNATDIPSSSSLVMTGCPDCTLVSGLRIFGNDQIARIMGYGDYQLGNVIISRVYYVEGLGHNLFSVGQFCDADLEVAFRKNTCFIRNLEGVDLLSGSRDTNLYTISLDDMLKSSPICLLSKASKTKSWLWHRRAPSLAPFLTLYIMELNLSIRTLPKCMKNVGISHQTSVARTPQQNGVVERRNQTLVEAARTMLIFSKALLFLWAEAINTACYTQNRSLIRLRYNKTPYELMQDKKPDLSFFYVFGSLCYPTNDHEDLGKFDAKADIGIFVGYAPAKKAFRIYNRRTRIITETIHVTFDELTAMASEQFSSGPGLHYMTPATSST